jgi:N utilization substance protein A
MAKQVIFQKVREAERDTVFNEYPPSRRDPHRTVKRLEPMDVIFDLGKAEARMPKREQSRLEQFAIGERVRVVLLRVDRAAKGPQVIVSRAAPALVQSLFQSEVPEIYDGTVSIRAIAREAGERTKIAVQSRDKDVDPVGACVGMKGMRVQSIIRELRGEKIDIIEFSDEITTFAEKALQPAKVARVSITDLAEKQLEVIVDDTQLSLAIGKKGQNVRLAAKLLQWKIDIKSEEEKRQEVEQQMQAMGGGPSTPIEQVTRTGRIRHGEAHRCRHHHRRVPRRHDRRGALGDPRHRRKDRREDRRRRPPLLRSVRRGRDPARCPLSPYSPKAKKPSPQPLSSTPLATRFTP